MIAPEKACPPCRQRSQHESHQAPKSTSRERAARSWHGQQRFNIVYQPNGNLNLAKYAVVIEADDGARGEYVALWAARMAMGQTLFLAKHLGRIRTSVNASIRSHGRGLH